MNKQMSLSFIHDELKEVKTHKREFLEKMDAILPWEQLYELVKPCYYEGARGNKPYDLELMLRIHLIQNLYDLSDEGTRNEIIDSRAFSDFCEVESSNQIPDGDTIGRFRQGKKIRYQQNRKPTQIKKLSASGQWKAKKTEHQKSSVRAKVEHVFAVIKGQLRYRKTRYRGLRKQTAKLNMLFALANLVLADRLCPAV